MAFCTGNLLLRGEGVRLEELQGKKVGVVMSSSFFGFFAHAGFVKALEALQINPCAYSGTSSGALITALSASGLTPQNIQNILTNLKKEMFWDPDYASMCKGVFKLFRGCTGLLKGEAFKELLFTHLPVHSFEECKLPCCIIATNLSEKNKAVFTQGSLADAVHASLAVPGLFQAVQINGKYYVDGGFISKAPVLDLYKLAKPEVIIVHYLQSRSFKKIGHSFLTKSFASRKISHLANSIGRYQEYLLECEFVRSLGCDVIEVASETVRVEPNKLEKGKKAFSEAEDFTEKLITNME